MGTISQRLINTGYYILVKKTDGKIKIEYNQAVPEVKSATIFSDEEGIYYQQIAIDDECSEAFIPESVSKGPVDPEEAAELFLKNICNAYMIPLSIIFKETETTDGKTYEKYFDESE